jgi:hypothetical protein
MRRIDGSRDGDQVARAANEKSPLSCGPLVELPGIEQAAKIRLTCGNTQSDDAKVRETT